jgi:UDP-3-O-[3-hydroxymyristoyl] N-acetylglucosamine deacetylase
MQNTLVSSVTINGIGLHSGKPVHMVLHPAGVDHGIVFKRHDVEDGKNLIPALYDRVVDTRMNTMIANDHGVRVGTIEHLMAALRGCNIDNVLVEIDSAEVPVMDGSSKPFIDAIDSVGTRRQSMPRRAIKILKEIVVSEGDKEARLSPSIIPIYAGSIDFPHSSIGHQAYSLTLVNGNFRHDVADCRTFGFLKDVQALYAAGLGLGGSLENAVVLDDDGVISPGGLRCQDEFIRHKILDAVGDLALAGGLILGRYEGIRAGHALNNAVLKALFADPSAWIAVDLFVDIDETPVTPYAVNRDRAQALQS